jgi:hypothetical protein
VSKEAVSDDDSGFIDLWFVICWYGSIDLWDTEILQWLQILVKID